MSSQTVAKSWERTDSTGNLHVFIVLKIRSNDSLKIISRDDLPNTLRYGRLSLSQKVMMRDAMRNNIEGVVIYIHPDRNECVRYRKNITNDRCQEHKHEIEENSFHHRSPEYQATVLEKQTNVASQSQIQIHSNSSNSNRNTTTDLFQHQPNQSKRSSVLNQRTDRREPLHDISFDLNSDISDFDDESANVRREASFEIENIQTESSTMTEDTIKNDIYLEKIKKLSLKVHQQASIIKERDTELRRLRATTISLPADPVVKDYFYQLADKIRHQSSGHKYLGTLAIDAKRLGISVDQLNETLKLKNGMTSIAREIFKKIIPKDCLIIDNWNSLPEDVLVKEKILIDFLERYFGSLQIEPKKIHTSLVGCLRNNRGNLKKQKKSLQSTNDQTHLHPDSS